MRLTRTMRPVVTCLAILVSLGLAACSSGSDEDSRGKASGAGTSSKEYCEAVKAIYEIVEQSEPGTSVSDDDVQRAVSLLSQAVAAAPLEVRSDLSASFVGDPYALEDLAQYNKDTCEVDVSAFATAPS